MPEGDTVHRAATRVDAALAGRTLDRGELRVPRFAAVDLRGRTVKAARSVSYTHLTLPTILRV